MGLALTFGFTTSTSSLLIAVRNSQGYPMGLCPDPDNPTLNTVYGAHRLGLRKFTHPKRQISKAFNREDGKIKRKVNLGISDDGDGSFEVGTEDETFMNYLRAGGYDNSTSDEMLFMALNRTAVSENTYFVVPGTLFQRNSGGTFFKYWQYMNSQIEQEDLPEINMDDGENPSPLTFTLTPSSAQRTFSGMLLSATDMVTEEDSDIMITVRSNYQLHQATWIANGSATTFTLPFLPLLSDVSVGGGNIICKNGVPTAITSLSTTTGLATLTSAGSSGDLWTVYYPTAYKTA